MNLRPHRRARPLGGTLAAVVAFGFLIASTSTTAWAEPAEDKPTFTSEDPDAGSNAAARLMAARAPLVEAAERISRLDPERSGLGGIR